MTRRELVVGSCMVWGFYGAARAVRLLGDAADHLARVARRFDDVDLAFSVGDRLSDRGVELGAGLVGLRGVLGEQFGESREFFHAGEPSTDAYQVDNAERVCQHGVHE